MRALLLLALVGGCTDFPAIDRNVCGNGIVEPGEDCDAEDATCVACAITCGTTACPDGSACGVDQLCHASGGQLSKPRAIDSVSINDFRLTDVDQDGFDDFVGLSTTSLVIRRGDSAASLLDHQSFVTPTQLGAPAFGDLDGDGVTDFVLPSQDGLVAYTSRYGIPSPVAVPSTVIAKDVQIVGVASLRPTVVAMFLSAVPTAANPDPEVGMFVTDFVDATTPVTVQLKLCDAHTGPAEFDLASLDVYDASGTNNSDYVLSVLTGTGNAKHACLININLVAAADATHAVTGSSLLVSPAFLPAIKKKPVLARLDYFSSDHCPALIISDGGAASIAAYTGELVPATGAVSQHCGLKATSSSNPRHFALDQAADGDAVIGRVALTPQFAGAGADALLTKSGFWGYTIFNTTIQLYQAPRPLKGAVTADLNQDGLVDGIMIPEGEDDLDVLLRFHDAQAPVTDGYQFLRIDTATVPDDVVLRDFDGNGLVDVAYAERSGDHARIMIAYNTSDLLLPPVQVATLDVVGEMVPLAVPSAEDPLSLSADLLVTVPKADAPLVTLLLGSPQRTMLPLLDIRPDATMACPNANPRANTALRGMVIGDFSHDPGATQYGDLFAIATRDTGATTVAPVNACPGVFDVQGWVGAGTADGIDSEVSNGSEITGEVDCTTTTPGAGELCVGATYVALPTSKGHDVVLGIDPLGHAGVADPVSSVAAFTSTAAFAASGDGVIGTLFAAALGGSPHVVAAFAKGAHTAGSVLACPLDAATGAPHDCVSLGAAITAQFSAVVDCFAATSGRFGFRSTTLDLVVACHENTSASLFRIASDGGISRLASGLPARTTLVHAGDLNGDRVDDLAIVHGDVGAQTLDVLTQCTTRDAACQEAP